MKRRSCFVDEKRNGNSALKNGLARFHCQRLCVLCANPMENLFFWWIGNMADVSNEKIIIEIVVCFFSLYFPISTWSLCRLCPSKCCDNTQQVSFIVIIASIFKFQINCYFAHFSPLHLKHTWKYILDIIWVNPPFKTNTEKMQLQ